MSVTTMAEEARTKKDQRKSRREKRIVSREEKPLNTALSRDLLRQADYIRRSEHTIKALARLRWRQDKRRLDHRKCKEELMAFSRPLIERARVILKGRDDLDVSQFLSEFEHFIIGSDRLTSTTNTESRYTSPEGYSTSTYSEVTQRPVVKGRRQDELENKPILAEELPPSAIVVVDGGHRSDQEVIGEPSLPANPEVANTSLLDGKLGTVRNKCLFPEVRQCIPPPPIKSLVAAEHEQDGSLANESTNQLKEETGSRGDVELQAAEVPEGTGDRKSTENDHSINSASMNGFGDRRKPWSSGSMEAVWLPQLWRQHKKRALNVPEAPGMNHRWRVAPQRM